MTGGDPRPGRRWTELPGGEGSVGLTPDEAATVAAWAATRERTARTKRAAASRRAAARAAMGGS